LIIQDYMIDITKLTSFNQVDVISTLYSLYSETGIEDYVVPYFLGNHRHSI